MASTAHADSHLRALVIGNSAYQNVPEAPISVENAEQMEQALIDLGFEVTFAANLDTISLWRTVAEFSLGAAQQGPDAVIFFYFAGRTVVEADRTFLLPVDGIAEPGMVSRALEFEQAVAMSTAGGAAVFSVLDLEQAVPLPRSKLGVGAISAPPKGLTSVIERPEGIELAGIESEAFVVVFSDDAQLPNLHMGPFIELVSAGARAFSEDQLVVSIARGEPSNVVLNSDVDEDVSERRKRLRAYDLSRTGNAAEIAAFAALYPNYERARDLLAKVSTTVSPEAPKSGEELVRPVIYSVPLAGAGSAFDGLTIAEIIKLKPQHAPIEGLPRSAWADKICSSCHSWDKSTLCEHGLRYQGDIWERASQKRHPLGGGFKKVLRAWAADGCLGE